MIKSISEELIKEHDTILDELDIYLKTDERKLIKKVSRQTQCRISLAAKKYAEDRNISEQKLKEDLKKSKDLPNTSKFFVPTDNGFKFSPEKLYEYVESKLNIKCLRSSGDLFFYKEDGTYLHDENTTEDRLNQVYERLMYGENKSNYRTRFKKQVKSQNQVDMNKLNQNKHLNLQNGVLKIKESSFFLQEHNPKHFDTLQAPVKFDPEAECPKFLKFLRDILPSEQDRKTIQEMLGHALFGEGNNYNKMFMLCGNGRNGKSTLMNVFENLLGPELTSSVSLRQLEESFKNPLLVDSKLNIDGDLESTKITADVKSLVGMDSITIEEKFKKPFEYKNDTVMVFLTNKIPETDDSSDGFFRKWVIINFPNKFTPKDDEHLDEDPKILKKLSKSSELSGILNWAIEGHYRLERQGHFTKDWSTDYIRSYWMRDSDPTSFFVERKVKKLGGGVMPKDAVYHFYKKFCDKRGLESDSKQQFKQKMSSKHKFKTTRKRLHNGERYQCWDDIEIR